MAENVDDFYPGNNLFRSTVVAGEFRNAPGGYDANGAAAAGTAARAVFEGDVVLPTTTSKLCTRQLATETGEVVATLDAAAGVVAGAQGVRVVGSGSGSGSARFTRLTDAVLATVVPSRDPDKSITLGFSDATAATVTSMLKLAPAETRLDSSALVLAGATTFAQSTAKSLEIKNAATDSSVAVVLNGAQTPQLVVGAAQTSAATPVVCSAGVQLTDGSALATAPRAALQYAASTKRLNVTNTQTEGSVAVTVGGGSGGGAPQLVVAPTQTSAATQVVCAGGVQLTDGSTLSTAPRASLTYAAATNRLDITNTQTEGSVAVTVGSGSSTPQVVVSATEGVTVNGAAPLRVQNADVQLVVGSGSGAAGTTFSQRSAQRLEVTNAAAGATLAVLLGGVPQVAVSATDGVTVNGALRCTSGARFLSSATAGATTGTVVAQSTDKTLAVRNATSDSAVEVTLGTSSGAPQVSVADTATTVRTPLRVFPPTGNNGTTFTQTDASALVVGNSGAGSSVAVKLSTGVGAANVPQVVVASDGTTINTPLTVSKANAVFSTDGTQSVRLQYTAGSLSGATAFTQTSTTALMVSNDAVGSSVSVGLGTNGTTTPQVVVDAARATVNTPLQVNGALSAPSVRFGGTGTNATLFAQPADSTALSVSNASAGSSVAWKFGTGLGFQGALPQVQMGESGTTFRTSATKPVQFAYNDASTAAGASGATTFAQVNASTLEVKNTATTTASAPAVSFLLGAGTPTPQRMSLSSEHGAVVAAPLRFAADTTTFSGTTAFQTTAGSLALSNPVAGSTVAVTLGAGVGANALPQVVFADGGGNGGAVARFRSPGGTFPSAHFLSHDVANGGTTFTQTTSTALSVLGSAGLASDTGSIDVRFGNATATPVLSLTPGATGTTVNTALRCTKAVILTSSPDTTNTTSLTQTGTKLAVQNAAVGSSVALSLGGGGTTDPQLVVSDTLTTLATSVVCKTSTAKDVRFMYTDSNGVTGATAFAQTTLATLEVKNANASANLAVKLGSGATPPTQLGVGTNEVTTGVPVRMTVNATDMLRVSASEVSVAAGKPLRTDQVMSTDGAQLALTVQTGGLNYPVTTSAFLAAGVDSSDGGALPPRVETTFPGFVNIRSDSAQGCLRLQKATNTATAPQLRICPGAGTDAATRVNPLVQPNDSLLLFSNPGASAGAGAALSIAPLTPAAGAGLRITTSTVECGAQSTLAVKKAVAFTDPDGTAGKTAKLAFGTGSDNTLYVDATAAGAANGVAVAFKLKDDKGDMQVPLTVRATNVSLSQTQSLYSDSRFISAVDGRFTQIFQQAGGNLTVTDEFSEYPNPGATNGNGMINFALKRRSTDSSVATMLQLTPFRVNVNETLASTTTTLNLLVAGATGDPASIVATRDLSIKEKTRTLINGSLRVVSGENVVTTKNVNGGVYISKAEVSDTTITNNPQLRIIPEGCEAAYNPSVIPGDTVMSFSKGSGDQGAALSIVPWSRSRSGMRVSETFVEMASPLFAYGGGFICGYFYDVNIWYPIFGSENPFLNKPQNRDDGWVVGPGYKFELMSSTTTINRIHDNSNGTTAIRYPSPQFDQIVGVVVYFRGNKITIPVM